jgi:hypothetical protein
MFNTTILLKLAIGYDPERVPSPAHPNNPFLLDSVPCFHHKSLVFQIDAFQDISGQEFREGDFLLG